MKTEQSLQAAVQALSVEPLPPPNKTKLYMSPRGNATTITSTPTVPPTILMRHADPTVVPHSSHSAAAPIPLPARSTPTVTVIPTCCSLTP